MNIELPHEPTSGDRPFILRCRFPSAVIEAGFPTRAAAEEAQPAFARACREAFRS